MVDRAGSENVRIAVRFGLLAPGVSLALLCSCGGGATVGVAGQPGSVGEAAMSAYLKVPHHSTLTATDTAGNAYTLHVDRVPLAKQTMFNGTSAYGTQDTYTLTKNGAAISTTQLMSFFLLDPYVPVGRQQGGAPCTAYYCNATPAFTGSVTSSFPLPATLKVGDGGPLAELTYTSGQTKSGALDGYESDRYAVVADSVWTDLLCLDSSLTGVTVHGTSDGLGALPESDCYAIDTAGTATLVEVSKSIGAETLTFR